MQSNKQLNNNCTGKRTPSFGLQWTCPSSQHCLAPAGNSRVRKSSLHREKKNSVKGKHFYPFGILHKGPASVSAKLRCVERQLRIGKKGWALSVPPAALGICSAPHTSLLVPCRFHQLLPQRGL